MTHLETDNCDQMTEDYGIRSQGAGSGPCLPAFLRWRSLPWVNQRQHWLRLPRLVQFPHHLRLLVVLQQLQHQPCLPQLGFLMCRWRWRFNVWWGSMFRLHQDLTHAGEINGLSWLWSIAFRYPLSALAWNFFWLTRNSQSGKIKTVKHKYT